MKITTTLLVFKLTTIIILRTQQRLVRGRKGSGMLACWVADYTRVQQSPVRGVKGATPPFIFFKLSYAVGLLLERQTTLQN